MLMNLTDEFTGVSSASINSARSEIIHKGHLSTPGKKREREKPVTEIECDEFVRSPVRRKDRYIIG
ncbi:hypothetical protein L9F63_023294 [Diploptera punctata]|uniref:Uncharacterized protein n=1 Tax=Diploptera punctata TaxID=6984 RepID=A0AAD8E8T6_DIPPU|nr:hypothetical protein L9F63_023294 [Diploptera punctata]